ncbi:MAG: Tad domain-containing protein [Planctomycetes bacterium]|nr:Tad domain-containing protein [Planctomycetota bacterium]
MLLLVAMLLFGLMAIAALTVDIGLARFTQSKMQAAADLAALEGLRGDRESASRLATWIHGSERVLELQGGLTDLKASALLTVEDWELDPETQPLLQTNQVPGGEDQDYGDMVAGTYDPDPRDPITGQHDLHREGFVVDGEYRKYARNDFEAGSAGTALLVRLRRTHRRFPPEDDVDRQEGVSSSGPALPFLFGMGTMILGADPTDPDAYSPRRDGLTVRATAIAELRAVVAIGNPLHGPRPLFPFAIEHTDWRALTGDPQAFVVVNGTLLVGSQVIGAGISPPSSWPLTLGDELDPANPAAPGEGEYVVPIVAGEFVLAFGWISVTVSDPVAGTFSAQKNVGRPIAPANATAVLRAPLPLGWSPSLMETLRNFAYDVPDPNSPDPALRARQVRPDLLTAPVLVR